MRYRLRTLLILLALLPPLLWICWGKYQAWRAERLKALHEAEVKRALREATTYSGAVQKPKPQAPQSATLNRP
jgi:hypothetical protein